MAGTGREHVRAVAWGVAATAVLAALIVIGSRNLEHFDAALVGYTFATLFATFGITYRYNMWLQRPPTRLYWRRGWQLLLRPRSAELAELGAALPNSAPDRRLSRLRSLVSRFGADVLANRFILRRGRLRWGAHWLIMWGCVLAAAITFPLVWGWIHFETVPGDLEAYRVYFFGFPTTSFRVHSAVAFIVFHGLVWSSVLVIAGVMLAFRRRMVDHGAAALQQFGEDILPLLMLFAVSVTGLMLTVSYTWMKGYAFDFLAILHAVTVIVTLLWIPFGKFFHIFQRPAQLGAALYKETNRAPETAKARCARCGAEHMSLMWLRDLEQTQRELGFAYKMDGGPRLRGATHYQQVCPKCRRALYGLAQGALWSEASQKEAVT